MYCYRSCEVVVERLRELFSYIPTRDINNLRSGDVMKKIGMSYRYSYEEQRQPKYILVTLRMYQLNFDGQENKIYRKYGDKYLIHFAEENS